LIGYAITRKTYNFPVEYWDKYPAQIAAITADDVGRVAKNTSIRNHAGGRCRRCSKIKTILEKYGPVELVDASGKPAVEAPRSTGAAYIIVQHDLFFEISEIAVLLLDLHFS